MTLYDRIYNRDTAGAVGLVCMVALVLTQLTIVEEAVGSLRPGWNGWQTWGAAIGFEAGTFAVGLIGAVAGFGWWQWVALVGFVGVSTFFGFDGSMQAQLDNPSYLWADLKNADTLQLLRAVIEGSFQALMYVGVVFSVHRLYAKGAKADAPPPRRPRQRKADAPADEPVIVVTHLRQRPAAPPTRATDADDADDAPKRDAVLAMWHERRTTDAAPSMRAIARDAGAPEANVRRWIKGAERNGATAHAGEAG